MDIIEIRLPGQAKGTLRIQQRRYSKPTTHAPPKQLSRQKAATLIRSKRASQYFGAFSDSKYLKDTAYTAILPNISEFASIIPGNSMKWETTEPSKGTFSFTTADQIVDYAVDNGKWVRGHNLVRYSQLLSWVEAIADKDELLSVMNNHITTYVSAVYLHWGVVNEAKYRNSVFYNLLGVDYTATAFKTARGADPDAKLYLNEYNNDYDVGAGAFCELAKNLTDAGVPINGVGIQGHYILGGITTGLQNRVKALADLGLEVAITELDIRIPSHSTDAKLEQQDEDYAYVTNACLAVDGFVGITVASFTDKYSWVPITFPG
ncbi:glycoside hydrolase superfamily [Aspergillus pseudoustus]|uniref:Beta-xylanase n=1 Tax=Aspergillus pseudoustus TaxID=1810923 RepID=A0ABR4J712_9EURO